MSRTHLAHTPQIIIMRFTKPPLLTDERLTQTPPLNQDIGPSVSHKITIFEDLPETDKTGLIYMLWSVDMQYDLSPLFY